MQVYNDTIGDGSTTEALRRIVPPESALYVDIETTGLSAQQDHIYLIGCAFLQQGQWKLIQWFDETGNTEADVLTSFLIFAKRYQALVHYNGDRFDLPFLTTRIHQLGLDTALAGASLTDKLSVDLYKELRPYKKLLGLPNYQQQTLEQFFGTGCSENRAGGDLIQVYRASSALRSQMAADPAAAPAAVSRLQELEKDLLLHNAADVRGLVSITPVLSLPAVFQGTLNVYKAQASHYRGYDGTDKEEIVLFARMQGTAQESFLPKITAARDGCYLILDQGQVTIKVPLFHGELRFYYANYKDYYYLPAEDQALHKSIASFVDKSHRVQATAETCYTRKEGDFLPEWEQFRTPFFKKQYKDKGAWFAFTPEMKRDKQFFCEYSTYVFHHIAGEDSR